MKTFEQQIKGTIGFWCNRLLWKNRIIPQQDLEAACWEKIGTPEKWEKLRAIWFDPHPKSGGERGVGKYLSVVCSNACRDELRKAFAAKRAPSTLAKSLSEPVGRDEEGNLVTLLDIISVENCEEAVPFLMADLEEVLSPKEYTLVIDHYVEGESFRALAKEDGKYGSSKSGIDRFEKKTRRKVRTFLESVKNQIRPTWYGSVPLKFRLLGFRSLRPDKISRDNLDHWLDSTLSMTPFYSPLADLPPEPPLYACTNQYCHYGNVLLSAVEAHDSGFPCGRAYARELGDYDLCANCCLRYWISLREQIEADLRDPVSRVRWRVEALARDLGMSNQDIIDGLLPRLGLDTHEIDREAARLAASAWTRPLDGDPNKV